MSSAGGAISRVYATALFELAEDGGALEERVEEVRFLLDVLDREEKLRNVLESPKIDAGKKEKLLRQILGEEISRDLRRLMILLVRKNRQFFAKDILEAFVELYRESKGRIRAKVTTAVPLEEETAARLAEGLASRTGKEITLDRKVDADLMGGVVVRFGDYIVDGSLKTRIRKMKESLLETSDQQGS